MNDVHYEIHEGIAEICLRRAPVNALTEAVLDAVLENLERARRDPAVGAVILASAIDGRFCAGLDLKAFLGLSSEGVHAVLEKLYTRLVEAQFNLGKPSIAAVDGTARGGGMTLAITCDLIVASRTATFGYPEIDVGVIPAIHYAHLPRLIGRHRAFDYLFTGRPFDAEEARSLGLVSRVAEDAREEARTLARTLAAKPPQALRMGRAAFQHANDWRRDVATAVETFCSVAATGEAKSRMAAFLEARSARAPK
jgi:enoyl-CoA hydratase/carnithine racemase